MATSPEDVAYITGFCSPTNAVIATPVFGIFTRQGVALVVPGAHASTLIADAVDVDHIICFGRSDAPLTDSPSLEARRLRALIAEPAVGPVDGLAAALERLGVRDGAIGLDESRLLTYEAWLRCTDHMSDMKVMPAAARLAEARRVKGPYEIECLGHALRITEEALNVVVQTLDRGVTERDAATLFAVEVIKRGGWPRQPLVGIGERTGSFSPRPGDVALRPGNLVRFDVGCTYKGYCSSIGRTAVLGQPSAQQESAYQAAQATLEAAIATIATGVTAGSVFDRAREALRANGLPYLERDHVGYGIGLEPCERPELGPGSGTLLELGEVLHVETAHIEISSMGVSVTDTVLVTRTGARALNRSHHGLIVLD